MGEYWEVTQDLVQPMISEPQLTEKRLKKPPFRFVFDVFKALQQATGMGNGLLPPDEQDATAITEKPARIKCLRHIIEFVEEVNNTKIEADPKHIVGGKNPEATNIFLQEMARAAKSSDSEWDRAMKIIEQRSSKKKSSEEPPPPPPSSEPPPPPPPDEESDHAQKIRRPITVDTTTSNQTSVKGKPKDWGEMLTKTLELRKAAEKHGADVDGCKTFSNRALGSEILSIQKEITDASKLVTNDPLSDYNLPDVPEDVDKLVEEIEAQLSAVRVTTEMMQANELLLDQLTKSIIPRS
eukprot:TRINITY_DN15993_c0_g1_i1.p1 TRINITY_DN15993_c0_g1~~TRINITY_DN15993_c0_g1_i1.p1  ORF type:complete len:296 (+),score=67.91 TRINITY_DN15993_c0_g1_i1:48-935(+)